MADDNGRRALARAARTTADPCADRMNGGFYREALD